MNKIKVGLVFEDKDTAKAFVCVNQPHGKTVKDYEHEFVYETPIIMFVWIKPFVNFHGFRLNFVFTTEEIRNTDWFDTAIEPMQVFGIGTIDQKGGEKMAFDRGNINIASTDAWANRFEPGCKCGVFGVDWTADKIGFGRLEILFDEDGRAHIHSESMDTNEDKSFTKAVLMKVIEDAIVDE